MQSPICWLASYPKSGNTWVRFLLHQYFFGRADRSLEIVSTIPDVHGHAGQLAGRSIDTRAGPLTLAKTHHRRSPSMPFAGHSARAIYIARHPRDVMWSCLNYAKLVCAPEVAPRITPRGYARNYIHLGGDPQFIQMGYGSLIEHANSWLREPEFPMLLVRYEDLRRDAARGLAEMISFLGADVNEDEIQRAVRDSSFDRMLAIEEADAAAGEADRVFAARSTARAEGRRFMNAGTLGRSLDEIDPGMDAELEARFDRHLALLGYERSGNASQPSRV